MMIRDDPNWHLDPPGRGNLGPWSPFVKLSDIQLLWQCNEVTDDLEERRHHITAVSSVFGALTLWRSRRRCYWKLAFDADDDDAQTGFRGAFGSAGAGYPAILRGMMMMMMMMLQTGFRLEAPAPAIRASWGGHNPHTQLSLNSEPSGQNPQDSNYC